MIAWSLFALLTLMWGLSFLAIRVAVQVIPPFAAAGLRIGLSAVLLTGVAWIQRRSFKSVKPGLPKLLVLGFLNFAFPWACLFWGEQYVAPALASIVNSSVPIFVFVASWLLLPKERFTALKAAGIGLGFLGILLVFSPTLRADSLLSHNSFLGLLAILGMAVSYAFGSALMKKWTRSMDSIWSTVVQGAFATLLLAVLTLSTERWDWPEIFIHSRPAMLGIVYLATFSTALAWIIFFYLIHEWGPIRASSVTYLIPMVAVTVDWFVYKKLPLSQQLLGAVLIISGTVLIHRGR